jgi:hypothetical protein
MVGSLAALGCVVRGQGAGGVEILAEEGEVGREAVVLEFSLRASRSRLAKFARASAMRSWRALTALATSPKQE